jgi:hypothetical protein
MSIYTKPLVTTNVFNARNFYKTGTTLSQDAADLRYLRLTGGTETGAVTFNSGWNSKSAVTVTNSSSHPTTNFKGTSTQFGLVQFQDNSGSTKATISADTSTNNALNLDFGTGLSSGLNVSKSGVAQLNVSPAGLLTVTGNVKIGSGYAPILDTVQLIKRGKNTIGSASGDTSISFGYTFSAAPNVVCTLQSNTDSMFRIAAVSTTGFTFNNTTAGNASTAVQWIAIGY